MWSAVNVFWSHTLRKCRPEVLVCFTITYMGSCPSDKEIRKLNKVLNMYILPFFFGGAWLLYCFQTFAARSPVRLLQRMYVISYLFSVSSPGSENWHYLLLLQTLTDHRLENPYENACFTDKACVFRFTFPRDCWSEVFPLITVQNTLKSFLSCGRFGSEHIQIDLTSWPAID